jgi:hypothetical protein
VGKHVLSKHFSSVFLESQELNDDSKHSHFSHNLFRLIFSQEYGAAFLQKTQALVSCESALFEYGQ